MLNRIIIQGRLVRDPELRKTSDDTPVASFTLACERDFKDRATGEKQTDFIDITAWRATAEFVSRYLTKGRMAIVEGRLQIRRWEGNEGNKRTAPEIVASGVYFADSKRDAEAPQTEEPKQKKAASASKANDPLDRLEQRINHDLKPIEGDDDGLPF